MKKVILVTLAFAPVLAFAQQLAGIERLVGSIGRVVGLALPIVVAIALLAFFWGLVKFIFAQGNEEAKGEGKKIMLWGLIALFIAASIWGLVTFARTSLGVGSETEIIVPTVR